jgi:uncharacterized protein YdaU (DUF1376 family)
MAKDPAVLFYTSDFLSGVSFLSMEQRGQYITLLCEQHQNGHIPKDHMIFICLSYDSPVISKFKTDKDGLYYNERMDIEKQKRLSYCESRGKNKKGKTKAKSYDTTHENHMSLHMDNDNVNDIVLKEEKSAEKRNILLPWETDTFKATWERWKKYKKEQHSFTYKGRLSEQSALNKLKGDYQTESRATAAIENSIASGYKGIFESGKNSFIPTDKPSLEPTKFYSGQELYS